MDRISVPYAAQVVRESMKSPEARRMGIPNVPLTELYNAARDYISANNGTLRLRDSVQSLLPTPRGVCVKLQNSEEEFDYGVLAVPFDALAKLLPDSAEPPSSSNPSKDLREKLTHFETSPITGVHLWFDRQITDLPHAVLLDRTIQWMFHKSRLLTRGAPLASSPTVSAEVDRDGSSTGSSPFSTVPDTAPEGRPNLAQGVSPGYADKTTESRRDDRNPRESPSYVELVISSSKSLRQKSRQEIIDIALTELREFFPAARDANLVKATVIKEVNATFSPTPGIDRYRPTSETPWPRIFLAGDWIATGWPATMEGAVRSGYKAAESITKDAGAGKRFLVPDLSPTGLMRILS